MLSAQRKGLEGSRFSKFFYVPEIIETVAHCLRYTKITLGFVEESVLMSIEARQIISKALGVQPIVLGTEHVS